MGFRQSWDEFRSFYLDIAGPKAWRDTLAPLRLEGTRPMLIVLFISYLVGFVVLAAWRGPKAATGDVLINAVLSILAPAAVIAAYFLFNLIMAPARLMKDYKRFRRSDERLARRLQQEGPRGLTPNQKNALREALKETEPQEVIVFYLATDTSGADQYATDLVEVFDSLNWHAGKRGEQEGDVDRLGVHIRVGNRIRRTQEAVQKALIGVGIQCYTIASRHVADRVELIVGDM